MARFLKYLALVISIPVLLLAIYIGYLWATYISDEVYEGSKYGFTIGASREETFANILQAKEKYPELFVYVTTGPRAGDRITFAPEHSDLQKIVPYDQWDLLIDGEAEFWNNIRISFSNEKVFKIYRHRQYFELP